MALIPLTQELIDGNWALTLEDGGNILTLEAEDAVVPTRPPKKPGKGHVHVKGGWFLH